MNPRNHSLTPVALAAAAVLMQAGAVWAQAAKDEPMSLDRVVVTGAAVGASKMKQSVSISTMEADQITNSGASSAAEILRSVPGVHTEDSGGEGNANVSVRGVPISAGGSRYVQFQEDGLPILMFGDIAFGTPDQFLRADYNVDHLEVIRGGSASTLASNAPGGIINFISKTGETAGGAAGLTFGAFGARQARLDMDYGGKLAPKTSFHVGGFSRIGEGDRNTGFNAASGGQIKGNITQQLDNGYVRASFKALDDKTPTFLPVPVSTAGGRISTLNGIDPRKAFFISPSFGTDTVLGSNGQMTQTNPRDGLHVKSTAFGLETELKLGNGFTFSDKFRKTSNSGRFIGMYAADNGTGATPQTSSTFTGVLFNTAINDLGNTVNDMKLSKTYGDAASGKATVTGGLFTSVQNVNLTWFWNRYNVEFKNNGANATQVGTGFTTFGGCCVRNFEVQYTNIAPYAAVNYELGALTLDGSVRRDTQDASGFAQGKNTANTGFDTVNAQKVNYSISHNSYSLGANYAINKDLATFARVSDGVAFSADRLLYGNPLDGSVPVAQNVLKQVEGGVKFRYAGVNLFATLFNARTSESNYEATTQTFTANKYEANGLELEAGYRAGLFRVSGGATFTHATIKASGDANTVGKKPRRLADFVLQAAPSMVFGDLEVGAGVVYNGKSYGDDANTITLPAYTVVNTFVNYQLNDRAQLSFSVNNLANTLAYTEVEGDGHAARAINGRTAKVALKYAF